MEPQMIWRVAPDRLDWYGRTHLVDLTYLGADWASAVTRRRTAARAEDPAAAAKQHQNYFHTLSNALRMRLWPRSFGWSWSNI
jgi:hypothetical protein